MPGDCQATRSQPLNLSREFRRNSGGRGYRFSQAQRMAWERRSETSSVPRKMTGRMWAIVGGKLAMQWSPEQISGRLRLDEVVSVSAEWIYRHVWEDKRNGGDLYKHLRRRGKKRNARGSKYSGRGHIPGRVDISERPGAAQEKGRWETGRRTRSSVLAIRGLWCRSLIGPRSSRFFSLYAQSVRRKWEGRW